MKLCFISSAIFTAIVICSTAHAGTLDGNYTSNKGNQLVIKGNKWSYSGADGPSSGTLSMSKTSVQFTVT